MPETTDPAARRAARPADLAHHVRTALGRSRQATVRKDIGETDRRVILWSIHELNAAFQRVRGLVTATPVRRTTSDGRTYAALEMCLTAYVPGVGAVQAVTDWDPADEPDGFALMAVRCAQGPEVAAARVRELHRQAAADYASSARQRAGVGL
ncbi:hypothetical protein [Streptomyces sp. C10-9-1]|uniref:hypothetical protein n=1 Tax=Streptomyces sp. C10-9-1 TaxID=1859285 RepID=UPI003F4A4FAE